MIGNRVSTIGTRVPSRRHANPIVRNLIALWVVILAVHHGLAPQSAEALSPKSPEVRAVVDRGVEFLETASDERLGAKCLVASVFLKEGRPPTHPKVQEAIEGCLELTSGNQPITESIYNVGIATIFLAELDPKTYRTPLARLAQALVAQQKPNGGWGYLAGRHVRTGDTSMTQYAVLGSWALQQVGMLSNRSTIAKVSGWLVRTQDPSGGWGYQGVDPGDYKERVKQQKPTLSLTAAGLGSLYICADVMGKRANAAGGSNAESAPPRPKLPPALVKVGGAVSKKVVITTAPMPFSDTQLAVALRDGDAWLEKNFRPNVGNGWTYYYLYALERAQSFRELAEGEADPNPDWYRAGYEYLAQAQESDGSWKAEGKATVDTAFAVLFLLRSTQKSIAKAGRELGSGLLVGGRGLPTDLNNVRIAGGKIISRPLSASAVDVLNVLEDPENPDLSELAEHPGKITLSSDPVQRRQEVDRLRRLAQSGDYRGRRLAVGALAEERDLDQVPLFIYALGDPDLRVSLEARDALRFVSRKFDGMGMPELPSFEDKVLAKEAWKSWYLMIRPDAQFFD